MLTPDQLLTLKAALLADPALTQYVSDRRDDLIAAYYNEPAVPVFLVWRNAVDADEIGNAWLGSDISGMSSLNMQRLQLMLASSREGVFDMTRADRRKGFEDSFGSNVNNPSRVNMRAVWRKQVTRLERLFSIGTGTEADPGATTFYGTVSVNQISNLLNED